MEVISPGALPNGMTIEKMKAGRRTPRNAIILEVMRDYGYVDARGMGVRTKVIPLTRQFAGMDPVFEASEDYLKTVIRKGTAPKDAPENVPEKHELSLKTPKTKGDAPENVPKNMFQGQLLKLIKTNPRVTYNALTSQTRRDAI
jgi:predicted HTH transcriptional regulator